MSSNGSNSMVRRSQPWPLCFRPASYDQMREEMNRAKGGILKTIDAMIEKLPENATDFSIQLGKEPYAELCGIYGRRVTEYRGFKVERIG